jgi:hypothetical protein
MNHSHRVLSLICAAIFTFAGLASAQTPASAAPSTQNAPQAPEWERLTSAQRDAVMAVVRERWNANPQQRAKMLAHAERWQRMTPEQRQRAKAGQHRWQQMSPEQRQQARAKFDQGHDQGHDLPPEQRAVLRERLKAMPQEQRREWIRTHRRQQGQKPQ